MVRTLLKLGAQRGFTAGSLAVLLIACGGLSKSTALDDIQKGVKEDNGCTLSLDVLSKLKVQHTSKGICVPKEGADKAKACIDALVAAHVTRTMPDAYMVAWPDDVSATSLKDLPAYDRHARNLVYSTCAELGDLRNGRFACADASAREVLSVTPVDPGHADVRYARDLTLRPALTAIEAACGPVSHPAVEATAKFVREGKGPWTLDTTPPAE